MSASAATETVVRLAGRGDGVTEAGRYVPFAAPGDVVRVDGDSIIVDPGPLHVDAPCRHFGVCGGCQMQHVRDQVYADWARDRILYTLGQHGVTVGSVEPTHVSPARSRRRASLRARRQGGALALGFNVDSSHAIVDLVQCEILASDLFALLAPLRALLLPLVPPGGTTAVTLTLADSGIDLMLANVAAAEARQRAMLAGFADAQDLARIAIEIAGDVELVAERRPVTMAMGGVDVALPPAAFLQATREGERSLLAAVQGACSGAGTIADLFCGVGTFALPLSIGARVVAIDAAQAAVRALQQAAREAGRRVDAVHRDLFRNPLRADELRGFDAVVFDPPRAGAREQALQLAASHVPRIAAVSCNPATFARDARILADGGYSLARLWPVAQFRWSNHVELVAEFMR